MKFTWKYKYVPEGQLEPDERGRWAIDCYIHVKIDKALPNYINFKKLYGAYMPVLVATMHQKGTENGVVPSMVDKFCVMMPSLDDAGNTGLSTQTFYYSNDIEKLKKKVEDRFLYIQNIFKYTKK